MALHTIDEPFEMARNAKPHKAIILAAGFGSRMQPLSQQVPKPLMPIWNRPILEHNIRLLQRWGVKEILINVHHRAADIVQAVQQIKNRSARISFSFEPEILGTGGALMQAAWFLDESPFWLLNADIAADLDPDLIIADSARKKRIASLWMVPDAGPKTVALSRGKITSFRSATPGAKGTATFSGLHLVSPRLLNFLLPSPTFESIIVAYEKAMKQGFHIGGVTIPNGYWADIGTPAQYLQAHKDVITAQSNRKPGQQLGPAKKRAGPPPHNCIAEDACVHQKAKLTNSIIWSGAVIGPSSVMTETVIGQNVHIDHTAEHVVVPAGVLLTKTEKAVFNRLKLQPITAVQLLPRGSARAFYRILCPQKSLLLIRYGAERKENAAFAKHAQFLNRRNIPVPKVFAHDTIQQFLVVEDLGTVDLLQHSKTTKNVTGSYQKVLNNVFNLHDINVSSKTFRALPLEASFSNLLYKWEHSLFMNHFLPLLKRPLSPHDKNTLRKELQKTARRLASCTPVLIHRDLQSSNILYHRRRFWFIDFQGMRLGAGVYDLASLLCDPYANLSPLVQDRLLTYCKQHAPNHQEVDLHLHDAAVQRLTQALGAFGRLGKQPGTQRFLSHIPAACTQLLRFASTNNHPMLRQCITQKLREANSIAD